MPVSLATTARLSPGAEGTAMVTFTNTTSADVDLLFTVPRSSDFGPGLGIGALDAAPKAPRAVHIRQSTTSADGKRSFDATWLMLSAVPPVALVRLAPAGTAQLRVRLVARGFLPSKTYPPGNIDEPPDPLPRGRYKVTLFLPIETGGIDRPIIDLDVR